MARIFHEGRASGYARQRLTALPTALGPLRSHGYACGPHLSVALSAAGWLCRSGYEPSLAHVIAFLITVL